MSKKLELDKAAESIAGMVIEWVDGGIKMGTDWRPGLASVIQHRLNRVDALSQLAALREELARKDKVIQAFHDGYGYQEIRKRLADAERRNAELQKDHDAQQLLALVRLSDLRDMAVEGDKIYDLLRCCYPFVLARCKETDYGDASARNTLEMIDREFKRAALNKPEEAKP
jgi:hypothetical protein